jgi:hypothetical protein
MSVTLTKQALRACGYHKFTDLLKTLCRLKIGPKLTIDPVQRITFSKQWSHYANL